VKKAAALLDADPNQLVAITDRPSATAAGAHEAFATVRSADYGQVLRGVSLTPGTTARPDAGRAR